MNQFMRKLVLLLFISTYTSMGQNASGTPVIFNASATAFAGDVIYLQGSGFGASPYVRFCFNDNNWVSLNPLAAGNETVTVQLPGSGSLPDLIQVEVSPDSANWSAPVFVNQAAVYSFDTNQIGSGNRFRIFGLNLFFSRTPTVRLVDTADGSSHSASIDTGSSKGYELFATAGAGIQPNHTYQVYVSNGYSGNSVSGGEIVAPITLQGRPAGNDYFNLGVPWAADLDFTSNIYNVQTDPRLQSHASGNGSPTDIWAIADAIRAASRDGGGIVYLPAGTYNLYFQNGCGVTLFSRVVLMGQGANNTFVNWGFGQAPGPGTGYAVCFAPTQSGVSDITFTNVNQSGNWPESALGQGSNEMFIQRTNWNIANARYVVMEHSSNSTMQNSNIVQGLDTSYNGPLNLSSTTNLVVRNNTVQFVAGAIQLDNVNGAVVENNTIIRDASQQTPTPTITHVVEANFTQNFMLLQNAFEVMGGTLPLSNDGETINSEAGGGTRYDEFRGTVQWASNNSITDGAQNFNWSSNNAIPNLRAGAMLAIVSGQGAGQWSPISGISPDGHTVWVANPWSVQPTSGSHYATFDWSAANWIVAGNAMSDNEKGIEFFDASLRDILITNNQLTNNSQILITPTEQPVGAGLFNLVLHTQITNNVISDTNHQRPAAISIVPREDFQNNNFGVAVIGAELRGNFISGYNPSTVISPNSLDDSKAITEGINLYWEWQTTWSNFMDDGTPSVVGTIIQGNTLSNDQAGIFLNSGIYHTVLAANINHSVGTPVADVSLPGVSHASIDTVVAGAVSGRIVSGAAWNQVTVGSLGASSLASQPASTTSFSLATSQYQFNTGSDSFSMLAEQVSADSTTTARVSISQSASAASRGLITFRSSASPTSPFVSAGVLQTGEFYVEWRPSDGAPVSNWALAMPNIENPLWIRIVKSGNVFQPYFSHDGNFWGPGIEINSTFDSPGYLVGLESLSDSIFSPIIQFDNVGVI